MIKIINGKRYNTKTAKLIGCSNVCNGLSQNDFNYWNEELYLTKKNQYFIFGEGHGNTQYRKTIGNSYGWGNDIRLLSNIEAQKWCETYLDEEITSRLFDIEEG